LEIHIAKSIQKRFVYCVVIWLAISIAPALWGEKLPTVDVCHPTVVAFFKPAANPQEEESGYNDALSDFQFYAGELQQPLKNKGIDFRVEYAGGFRTKCGRHANNFFPDKIAAGYYFIAPGKHLRIEYGVMPMRMY
jgi:hypothetical protein